MLLQVNSQVMTVVRFHGTLSLNIVINCLQLSIPQVYVWYSEGRFVGSHCMV